MTVRVQAGEVFLNREQQGAWTPRVPLVLAERHVDYPAHNTHIAQRRALVEKMARPTVQRLAFVVITFHGLRPVNAERQLAKVLQRHLDATARFGYEQAQAEIGRLRRHPGRVVLAAYAVPDAGRYARYARSGLSGVRDFVRHRVASTVTAVTAAAATSARKTLGETNHARRVALAALAANAALHNNVIETVGEVLNMGRTAGVTSLANPPQFAMRSEQLDQNTCEDCEALHGLIFEIGTSDYDANMPPQGCLGAGRCRGIYVYGDESYQLQQAA